MKKVPFLSKVVSLIIAELFFCTSVLPAWATPSRFLRPKFALPGGLTRELKSAKDGSRVQEGVEPSKLDALGKHIYLTNERGGSFAAHHEIEVGSAEHNRLMERLKGFADQNRNIQILLEQLETSGIAIRFSEEFGALGIRVGEIVYLDKHLLGDGVLHASREAGALLEGLLYQQWVHDSTLDFDLHNEFTEEVVAVMFETLAYLRTLQGDPDFPRWVEKFFREELGIRDLGNVITDELLGIAREMAKENSALYSDKIGITKEGIGRLVHFVKKYYPEYQHLELPLDILERVSEKRDLLLLRSSLAKMRNDHEEELNPVGNVEPWDYILLAAASEEQKRAFEAELDYRRALGLFAPKTKWMVVSPPEGVDTGTGGAIFNALRTAIQDIAREQKAKKETFHSLDDLLKNKKVLMMLSGGPSKRIPIFSAVGKAFTPLPVAIGGERRTSLTTTLFDELYMMLSGAAAKMTEGLIVIPGDAHMIFDWDGVALEGKGTEGFVEVVWRAPAEEAVTHGVRITGPESDVMQISVEKKSVEELKRLDAVDPYGYVNLSTALLKGDREVARRLAELGGLRVEEGTLLYDREMDIVGRASDAEPSLTFDWFEDFLPALGERMTKEQYVTGKNAGLKEAIWKKFREVRPVTYHVRSVLPFLFADFGTTGQAQDHLVPEKSMLQKVYAFERWLNSHIASSAGISGSARIYDAVLLGLREFEVKIDGQSVIFTVDPSETIIESTDPSLKGGMLDMVERTIQKSPGNLVKIEDVKRETFQTGFVGDHSMITMSQLSGDFKIGENCFVFMVDDPKGQLRLANHVVLYQVPVRIGVNVKVVNVVYGAQVRGRDGKIVRMADDPKKGGGQDTLFGENIKMWLRESGLSPEEMIRYIWPGIPEDKWSLWNAKLYAPGDDDFHLTNWMMEPPRRSAPSRWLQMMKQGELLSMEEIAEKVDYMALIARRKAVRENEFLRIPTYVDAHLQRAWGRSLSVLHTVDYDPQDDTKQKGAVVKTVSSGTRVGVGIGEDHTIVRTTNFSEIPLGARYDPNQKAILDEQHHVIADLLWIDRTFRRTEVTSRGTWVIRYDPRRDDPTKPKIPQTTEVMQPILPGGFHLNAAPPLLIKPLNKRDVRFVATKVPLFRHSTLLVSPELRPQVMLRSDVQDALSMLRNTSMIVWFNSLGGAASVNHFHLQGIYTTDLPLGLKNLPVEEAKVSDVANVGSVRVGYLKDYPAQAMVFAGKDEAPLAEVTYRYVNFLQEKNIPHNVVFLKGKVIVFVKNREKLITRLGINPAAPELSGIVTLSDPKWMGHPPSAETLRKGLAEATVSPKELIRLLKEFMSRYTVDEGADVNERLREAFLTKRGDKIRRYLSQKLSQDGFSATLAFIQGILATGDGRYLEGAIHALGYLGSESAVNMIKKQYKNPRTSIRVAVVNALGKVKGRGAISELVEMLEDEFFGVYLEAAYVLGESGDKQATPALVKKLNEEKPGTLALKEKLARALGKIGDVGKKGAAVDALIRQSRASPYESLRRSSVWSLGEMHYEKGTPQREAAIEALMDRMEDEAISVRLEAPKALTKIVKDHAILRDKVGDFLIQRLEEEKDWQVREGMVRAFGELRYEEGLERLNRIMTDQKEDLGVRVAAFYALSQFVENKKAVQYLMEAVKGATLEEIMERRNDEAWIAGRLDRKKQHTLVSEATDHGLKVVWESVKDWEQGQLILEETDDTLNEMRREGMVKEFWDRSGYWFPYEDRPERLGWQRLPDEMAKELGDLGSFVEEIKGEGVTDVVVMGMGGATQGIYAYRETFGEKEGIRVHILDTTSPRAIEALEERLDLKRTLFIFSSKAGAVPEGSANFYHFWSKAEAYFGKEKAGKAFVAITNPDFPLDLLAKKLKFRKIFPSKLDTGGRFEALSMEMLVMAALMGVKSEDLLSRVNASMIPRTRSYVDEGLNPVAQIAAFLDVLRRRGIDKMSVVTSEHLKAFKPWLEQLISESLGKEGKGILPTSGEEDVRDLVEKGFYRDRVIVLIQTEEESVGEAIGKGIPIIRIVLPAKESLGELFYLWEMVTMFLGRLMNINPFNAPAVIGSKQRTAEYVEALMQGTFHEETKYTVSTPEGSVTLDYGAVMRIDVGIRESDLDGVLERLGTSRDDIAAVYAAILYLSRKNGNEFATLLPYMTSTPAEKEAWQVWQSAVHQVGYSTYTGEGPRFQHSALQLFMDGPNRGVHTIVAYDNDRLPLLIHDPASPHLTYGQFIRAQSLGTQRALEDADRMVMRLGVQESASSPEALRTLFQKAGDDLAHLAESERLEREMPVERASDGGKKELPFTITYDIEPSMERRLKFIDISVEDLRAAIEDAFYNTPLLQETLRVLLKDSSFRTDAISEVKMTYGGSEDIVGRFYLVAVKHSKGASEFVLDVDRYEYHPSAQKPPKTFRILDNLAEAYKADPRYTIQPYAKGIGAVTVKTPQGLREVKMALTTKERLKGWDNAYLIDPLGQGPRARRFRSLGGNWQIKKEIDLFLKKIIQMVTFYYVKLDQRAINFIIIHGDFMFTHPYLSHSHPIDLEDYAAQFMDESYTDIEGAHKQAKIVSIADLKPMEIPEFVQYLLTYEEHIVPNLFGGKTIARKERIFEPEMVWGGIEAALVEVYGKKEGRKELLRWKKAYSHFPSPATAKDGADKTSKERRVSGIQVSPSLLAIKEPGQFAQWSVAARRAGAERIHFDVMGGGGKATPMIQAEGVQDTTGIFTPERLREIKTAGREANIDIPVDVHLAVMEPSEVLLSEYIEAGADSIALHWEAFEDKEVLRSRLQFIRENGAQPGLTMNPDVDIDAVGQFLQAKEGIVRMISLSGVPTGLGGQKFQMRVLGHIRRLRNRYQFSGPIQVDGGIEPELSAARAREAGADILVAGTAFFGREETRTDRALKEAYERLRGPERPLDPRLTREKPLVQRCVACEREYPALKELKACPICGKDLEFVAKGDVDFLGSILSDRTDVWRYAPLLPLSFDQMFSVGVGNTPILYLPELSEQLGVKLYVKLESENPTGTFKDREAAFVIGRARAAGFDNVVMQSTGNTGVAISYHAGLAGLNSYFFAPARSAYKLLGPPLPKGNKIILVQGDPVDVKNLATRFAETHQFPKISPFHQRSEANVTEAYEIGEAILRGEIPPIDFCLHTISAGMGPVGLYLGGERMSQWTGGKIRPPKIVAVQISEFAPAQKAWEEGLESVGTEAETPTYATDTPFEPTLHTTNIASYYPHIRKSIKGSQGILTVVTPALVQKHSGEFREALLKQGYTLTETEKASDIAFAGLMQQLENGTMTPGSTVLLIVTGKGVKPDHVLLEPDAIIPPDYDPHLLLRQLQAGEVVRATSADGGGQDIQHAVMRALPAARAIAEYQGWAMGKVIEAIYLGKMKKALPHTVWRKDEEALVKGTRRFLISGTIGITDPIAGIMRHAAEQYLKDAYSDVDLQLLPIPVPGGIAGAEGASYFIPKERLHETISRAATDPDRRIGLLLADIGGTKTVLVISEIDREGRLRQPGKPLMVLEFSTPKGKTKDILFNSVGQKMAQLVQEATEQDIQVMPITAVSFAAGFARPGGGLTYEGTHHVIAERFGFNLGPDMPGTDVPSEFSRRLSGYDVFVVNDGVAQFRFVMDVALRNPEIRSALLGEKVSMVAPGTGVGTGFGEVSAEGELVLYPLTHITDLIVDDFQTGILLGIEVDGETIAVQVPTPDPVWVRDVLSGKAIAQMAMAVDRTLRKTGRAPVFLPLVEGYERMSAKEIDALLDPRNEQTPLTAKLINQQILEPGIGDASHTLNHPQESKDGGIQRSRIPRADHQEIQKPSIELAPLFSP